MKYNEEDFFFRIPEFDLNSEERELLFLHYLDVADKNYSYITFSGRKDGNTINQGLQVAALPFLKNRLENLKISHEAYFVLQEPGVHLQPHCDDERMCVINAPVLNPQEIGTFWFFEKPTFDGQAPDLITHYHNRTYVINTKKWHELKNVSKHLRLMLQIEFKTPYSEVIRMYRNGTLLNKKIL